MSPALFALMLRVYRNIRTNIPAQVDLIFNPGTQATQNAAADSALAALVVDVHAKRSDDGLRRTRAALAAL